MPATSSSPVLAAPGAASAAAVMPHLSETSAVEEHSLVS